MVEMKTKKFNKKLTLTKETVADLSHEALSNIKGGIYTVFYTCGDDCNSNFTCARATFCTECWTVDPPFCH